jgi:hypothetical protein
MFSLSTAGVSRQGTGKEIDDKSDQINSEGTSDQLFILLGI